MQKTRKVQLDAVKLKDWLKIKGICYADISDRMGYSRDYISRVCRDGCITLAGYKSLCNTLDVPEDTFILQETVKENKQCELSDEAARAQYDDLRNILLDIAEKLDKMLLLWGGSANV